MSGFAMYLSNLSSLAAGPCDEKNGTICCTPVCKMKAEQLASIMDMTADPCEDWTNFSCGKFLRNTPIPDGGTSITLADFGQKGKNIHPW